MPEPSGRTFAEMDMLFEQRVSARKFATTKVDVFEVNVAGSVMDGYKDTMDAKHLERMSQGSTRS